MKRLLAGQIGFTIIELLIVIAVITVLVAIGLPVYTRAREQAKSRACMANLMQIARSIRMYRMDEGAYPGPYDPATGRGGLNDLYPAYLESRQALICPNDESDNQDYIQQTVRDGGVDIKYAELLTKADTMYLWNDPGFFAENYSSYNNLYNWCGYTKNAGNYYLLSGGGAPTQEFGIGDNLAFWYMWFRWDPRDRLNLSSNWNEVDNWLHYHLAQQIYWSGYKDEFNVENQPTRLNDNLGRPLWDPGNTDQNSPDYMPYGQPSSMFPGLINPNAPDNAIITRCPHHREYTQTTVQVQRPAPRPGHWINSTQTEESSTPVRTSKDIVVRLDGSAAFVTGVNFDWAKQPRQTR